jgi:hypothetical protein
LVGLVFGGQVTGSKGINPLTEDVKLLIGNFPATMPAGSFRKASTGAFQFGGIINGVQLEVVILPLGGNQFSFDAQGQRADLTGSAHPLPVVLSIGDDGGATMVPW